MARLDIDSLRLANLRKGDWEQFERLLNSSDLTAQEVRTLLKHPSALEDMLKAMRAHDAFRFVHGYYTPVPEILDAFTKRLQETTPHGLSEFAWIAQEFPSFTHDPDVVVLLEANFATLQQTFDFAWAWTKSLMPNSNLIVPFRERFPTGPENLRLREGTEPFEPFTRRWRRVDVMANPGHVPESVRTLTSPGVALLYLAAQHPRWIRDCSNGGNYWIPGLEYRLSDSPHWNRIPYITRRRDDSDVHMTLSVDPEYERLRGCTVPEFVEERR